MINGSRIKQAREFCGMTQKELAEHIGSTQSYIAHIEGGRYQPNDEVLASIAAATRFPIPFFSQDDPPDFPLGSLLFRARASTTAIEKLEAYQYGKLMFGVAEHMLALMKRVPVRLPQLRDDADDPDHPGDAASAAQITRAALGLSPDRPVPHLIHAVERAGVLVLAAPAPLEGRDGFSLWAGSGAKRPVIVISGGLTGDRLRLTVAHELGHLVMHQAPKGTVRELEKEAYVFASELLMPEAAMRDEITVPVTLTSLAPLKGRWGVSIAALVTRARRLDIITERQRTYLYQQLGAHGLKRHEPSDLDIPIERPRALRKMVELVYGTPINYQKVATDMHLPPMLTRQIIEAHASAADLQGSGAQLPVPREIRELPRK